MDFPPSENNIVMWDPSQLLLPRLKSLKAYQIVTNDSFSENLGTVLCGAFSFEAPTPNPLDLPPSANDFVLWDLSDIDWLMTIVCNNYELRMTSPIFI